MDWLLFEDLLVFFIGESDGDFLRKLIWDISRQGLGIKDETSRSWGNLGQKLHLKSSISSPA